MKSDTILKQESLVTGEALARAATVKGNRRIVRDGRRKLLSVETGSVVRFAPPRSDLSDLNVLVVHLKLATPFEGSLVARIDYTTRSPGLSDHDMRFSVLHFNQPRPWKGWQRILIPAENLVATGFPDGWKNVREIALDFHSREDRGWVILGDVEALAVDRPPGPRMSDQELLEALDLDRPDLAPVARLARRGDTPGAIRALATYLRTAKLPPTGQAREMSHWRPATADQICRHWIMEQQLPSKIDWQVNPIGYLEWNHAFNRHLWITSLTDAVRAARGPRRRKYARALDELMSSWIQQNAEPVGHNGGLDPAWETLSTSCRINWAWPYVLEAARLSSDFTDRTLIDTVKMIHAHAEHLLNYWGHCNWFISESTAILTAAALVPAFRRADHWRKTAIARLQREMKAQVFPDGVQYELSPGYHTMCADLFYLAWTRARFRGWNFSHAFAQRLWAMYDYLAAITRPDGSHPVMNDSGPCCRKGNERLLKVGQAEKRPDWIWAGSGAALGTPPATGSQHFPDAGYAVMRSGWAPADRWAFFDLAEFGAAHQHEDKLQVEFYAFGSPLAVDPGISSYMQDPVVRFFRRSEAHNTVTIDGAGQWRRKSGDYRTYGASSRGKNLWAAGRGLDFAQGAYADLYGERERGPLSTTLTNTAALQPIAGVTHTRALLFVRPDYWLVLDSIAGRGRHLAEALWHFTPMHVRIDAKAATVRTNRLGHGNLELICRGDWADARLRLVTGSESPAVQGFIALDDEVKPAPVAVIARRKRLPIHGATVAVPYASGSESHYRAETRAVKGRRGAGLLITVTRADGLTDRFLWRHTGSGTLEAGGLRADARLALVRTDANGIVAYAALMDGRSLRCATLTLTGRPRRLVEH